MGAFLPQFHPAMLGNFTPGLPTERGRWDTTGLMAISRQSLPTDPVGTFVLTLENVVVGSAILIRDQADTVTLHASTAASSTVAVTLQAYVGGSPLNSLRIKVRKGSASPFYQPWETLTTAFVGAQSIFVSQTPDD